MDRMQEAISWWGGETTALASFSIIFPSAWGGWFLTGIAILTLGSIGYAIRPTMWQLRHPRKAWWMHKIGYQLAEEYEQWVEKSEVEERVRKAHQEYERRVFGG